MSKKKQKKKLAPNTIYKVTEEGELTETTEEEAMKEIHENRDELIAKLKDCIDNEKPFLLITCTTRALRVENLRVTSSEGSQNMAKLLSPLFLGLPYGFAKGIVSDISDMVFLRMVDDYIRDAGKQYLDQHLLNYAIVGQIPKPRIPIRKIQG